MYEIRIHGVGGQGVVTMTDILALAIFYEGYQVQAFPYFGPERTGSPVTGYVRFDRKVINIRQQIYEPDLIIVLDESLLTKIKVAEGAKKNSQLLINTQKSLSDVSPATKLPIKNISLYHTDKPTDKSSNIQILGYCLKKYNLAGLENCLKAIKEKMSNKDKEIIKNNLKAAELGYDFAKKTTT